MNIGKIRFINKRNLDSDSEDNSDEEKEINKKCIECNSFFKKFSFLDKNYKECNDCLLKKGLIKYCNKCNTLKLIEDMAKGRNQCKSCRNIANKCIHNIEKKKCVECGGASICEHGKYRSICKDCKGGSICEHNRIRTNCKECGGSQICEHNRIRTRCKDCKGASICEHNKIRINCKDCGGSQVCEHNKLKHMCKDCKGSQICEHNKERRHCKDCKGSQICEHNKFKKACIICNLDCACRECKQTYVDKSTFCYPLCEICFCFKFPNNPRSTRYKIKERYLIDELKQVYPSKNITMVLDKTVEGGCSLRRPDVLIECLTHSIIIECDEHQHKKDSYSCDNKRLMELFNDLGNRPLVLLRFNPDSYKNKKGKQIDTCFKPITDIENLNVKRFYDLNKIEWDRRVKKLVEKLDTYLNLNTFPEKEITEIKLFYDSFD